MRICHRTASESNPYSSNEPTIGNNGDLQGGHLDHTGPVFPAKGPDGKWGDIIPPYTYTDQNGQTQTFPGYNWTPEGQAIWQSGPKGCGAAQAAVTPILECVEPVSGGGFLAHFGYDNPNADPVVNPVDNAFTPDPADRGQPTEFAPGRHVDAFQAPSPDGQPITWSLTGNTETASSGSKACQSITVVKVLNPSTDSGRFDLEIDGKAVGKGAAVGDGGSTGTIAVTTGEHTVGESGAKGTSLDDYDIQIGCVGGGSPVSGTTSEITVNVQKGQAIVCTITNSRKADPTPPKPLVPVLQCVVFRNGAPDTAVWSYSNENDYALTIPVGLDNSFAPAPPDRGQPTTFEPGTWAHSIGTAFNGAATVAWTLAGQIVTASSSSPRCTATIELRKVVAPADDQGVFNLLLNGHVLATGGNGTTAGPYTIGVGEGTVSETAGPGTNLADYGSAITCTRNGTEEISISGTKVDGAVANGDFVVCTFTNTRITSPPTPIPPEPPLPPTPNPEPPVAPNPEPPSPSEPVDLVVTKTAQPTTVKIGQNITWTVTVTNASSVAANDVNVVKVSERSYRTQVISVTPSQGTCTTTGCDLGRIAPGASATITVVTKATQIGPILNVVRVGSEEGEANYVNNTAAALVRVIGPLKPPPPRPVCHTLGAAPRALRVGGESVVLTIARDRFGVPVPGVTVRMRGRGVSQHATTNSRGIARFTLIPSTVGFVTFQGGPRSLAGSVRPCATFLAVLRAAAANLTG